MGLHGYTHPQILANLEPALALDQSLDGGDYTLRILWGLWVDTLCAGRIEESLVWAERLLATAEQHDNESMRLAGNWAACDSHYFLGNFARAIQHAEVILARYDAERDRHIADLIIHDPKTIALAYKAAAEWMLGYPQRSAESARAAISHSDQRRHFFDFCWVRTFLGHTAFSESSDIEAIAHALEQAEPVATEQKLVFFTDVYCPMTRAFWLLQLDRPQDAEPKFRETTASWKAAGLHIYLPCIKALHADTLRHIGNVQAALCLLDEALEQIARPGWRERGSLSNVLRIKACALQDEGDAQRAEAVFREALEVAREQDAKSWELRAATDYARLMQGQGRHEEALALVQPLYDWFTEGHETRDLREAAALLEQLRESSPIPAQQRRV
jgi:predicted ATPase